MKKPVNFEKISHKTFYENAVEWELSFSNSKDIYVIPTDKYKKQFSHVILIQIPWNENSTKATLNFCRMGEGSNSSSSISVSFSNADFLTMENFINWVSLQIRNHILFLKK